jgi:hypothetical protein
MVSSPTGNKGRFFSRGGRANFDFECSVPALCDVMSVVQCNIHMHSQRARKTLALRSAVSHSAAASRIELR